MVSVHDRVAEQLESMGFWRRASTRWLDVMNEPGHSAIELEWLRQRRIFCHRRLAENLAQKKANVGMISSLNTAQG